jgi:hypothetical protein
VYHPLADDRVRLVEPTAQTLSIDRLFAYPGPERRAHFVVAGRASKGCLQFRGGCGAHRGWYANLGVAAKGVDRAIKGEQEGACGKKQYKRFAEQFELGRFSIASRTRTHLNL